MTLHLVRHGRPHVDFGTAAATWELDPAGYDDVWQLRDRLPHAAAWYSSPEPKALETAALLTGSDVGVVDALREHERAAGWIADFPEAVRRAFAQPTESACPGWEPLSACRDRIVLAAAQILDAHGDEDVVLVGHGTAWTLLAADLAGSAPDLSRWEALRLPDVIVIGGSDDSR